MPFNSPTLNQTLFDTSIGQAVYDSLIQANVNPATVSLEAVKQMLVAECQFRQSVGAEFEMLACC